MARPFQTVDYEGTLKASVTIDEALPSGHLARYVVEILKRIDLSRFYARYKREGAPAIAPEAVLGLLIYGYATGTFSSRKLERASHENLAFRYVAGGQHPDHDTIANFRVSFSEEIQGVFVSVLELAQAQGILKLGNVSLDGSKIHADASKSKAVSYKRARELHEELKAEVDTLLKLANGEGERPPDLNLATELQYRHTRLAGLEEAMRVIEQRAQERHAQELQEYQEKLSQHTDDENKKGGRPPKPPPEQAQPKDGDQYNFTDPDSRIMKNSKDGGFDQHYNVQAAVTQDSRLIVGESLSNHTNDYAEAIPTVQAIPASLGLPTALAMDTGYCSKANLNAQEFAQIDLYIATGRYKHRRILAKQLEHAPALPLPATATPRMHMAAKLKTALGQSIYRLRKSTVEPVIGIIKEAMSFRQFSLRGQAKAAGEWSLVCLAYNVRRLSVIAA